MNGARRSTLGSSQKGECFFVSRSFQTPPQSAGFEIRVFLYFLRPPFSLFRSLHFSLICLQRYLTIMVSTCPPAFTYYVTRGAKVSSRSLPTTITTTETMNQCDLDYWMIRFLSSLKRLGPKNLTKQDFKILKPLAKGYYGKVGPILGKKGSTQSSSVEGVCGRKSRRPTYILHESAKQGLAQQTGVY